MGVAENIADLRSILSIVAEETGALKMEDADEDSVGWTTEGPLPMTFGHVRRAHAALAALEAALSAAEPVATVAEMGAGGMRVLMPHPPGSADHLLIGTKLYAAPTAPSVAVKALDWSGFKGVQINDQWMPDDQELIYTALGVYDGDGDMDDDAREQIIERLLAAWQRSALSAQVQDVAERGPKEIATWEDQQAFEAWAGSNRYDMHQHPLHYLFMDPKTNAARQGWKAALQFIRDRSAAAPAKQEGDRHE